MEKLLRYICLLIKFACDISNKKCKKYANFQYRDWKIANIAEASIFPIKPNLLFAIFGSIPAF